MIIIIITEIAQKIIRKKEAEQEVANSIAIIIVTVTINAIVIRHLDVGSTIATVIIREVVIITDSTTATTMFITVVDYFYKTMILRYYFYFNWKVFQVSFFYSFLL